MDKLVYFDYCAIALISILLFSTIYRGMTKGRLHKLYVGQLVVAFFATIADIFAVQLDLAGAGNVYGKYIFHTLYLYLHNLSTPLYMLFLMMLAGEDYKLRKKQRVLLCVPTVIMIVALVLNCFNHKVFYLDSQDTYTRGPWFFILYVTTAFYVVAGFYLLVRFRKRVTNNQFLSLMSMFVILITATILQLLIPKFLFEMFACSLVLLLFSTMVLRAEDYMDTDSGFGKKSAYVEDMTRALASGNTIRVVMANITNYRVIHDMLGYVYMRPFVRMIADRLDAFEREYKSKAELYYLGDGRFRFVFDKRILDRAEGIAQKLNELMQQDVEYNGMKLNLLTVVCVADCPEVISDVPSLMAFGEDLTVKYYNGQVRMAKDIYNKERYAILQEMDSIIEDALMKHKFQVYYQPIYDVEGKKFTSAEALLRLIDDKHGFISPDIFIPAAEKSGAIHKIGAFVLEEVCKFIASDEYKRLGLLYIEINLSVVQCMREDLADEIIGIMNRYQIRPEQVNLEITETAASYSQNVMMDNIEALTQRGIRFSLDDYGTGYSNVRRIATMPLNIVKLDKEFINVGENARLQIVLENTIRMIKDMNMKIVVEGVETEEMVNLFKKFQCEYIQGFYFSKPLPKGDFIHFLESKKNSGDN